jgi:hypothetical protein
MLPSKDLQSLANVHQKFEMRVKDANFKNRYKKEWIPPIKKSFVYAIATFPKRYSISFTIPQTNGCICVAIQVKYKFQIKKWEQIIISLKDQTANFVLDHYKDELNDCIRIHDEQKNKHFDMKSTTLGGKLNLLKHIEDDALLYAFLNIMDPFINWKLLDNKTVVDTIIAKLPEVFKLR